MSDANLTTPPQPSHAFAPDAGAPAMSTPETLSNIFFEPGATFEALRARPRFLVAALIMLALAILVTALLFQRINFEKFMREQIEKSPQTEQMPPEQKEQVIAMQTGPVGKAIFFAIPVVATVAIIAGGAALYLLGAMMMGGGLSYKQALSVWTYSSFPPAVLTTVVSVITLFLKSADDIDLEKPGAGLMHANLGVLLGPDSSPVMRSLLGSFDLFAFYGIWLAAVGLRKVGRMSSGSAWTVAIGLWALFVILKVAWAAMFGK